MSYITYFRGKILNLIIPPQMSQNYNTKISDNYKKGVSDGLIMNYQIIS